MSKNMFFGLVFVIVAPGLVIAFHQRLTINGTKKKKLLFTLHLQTVSTQCMHYL